MSISEANSHIDRYAVIGNPIDHSKSPEIHLLFADQTGETLSYEKILANKNEFPQAIENFFNHGGKGLNVTVPFKTDAWKFVDEKSGYAKNALAVNTIYKSDKGKFIGANTDGIGLLRDLKKTLRLQLINKKILIIGAGGATQGIIEPLLNEKPTELYVANRTLSKAQAIAKQFSTMGKIETCSLAGIPKKHFDLILHATSAGLHGNTIDLPKAIIGPHTCCYDLLYADQDTVFMRWAKEHHAAKVVDGFGMLLEQAAESFYLWRNKRPDTGMAYHYFRPEHIPKPGL